MSNQDRRATPTWDWIAGIALAIIIAIAGYSYSDTQSRIKDLDKTKADKETVDRMYQDVRDIKAMVTSHVIESGSGRVAKRDGP